MKKNNFTPNHNEGDRGAAEKLKREAELFLNRCEPYQRSSAESKKRFANRIERIAKDEILSWENLQEESYKPFKDETQSALQSGGSPAALNQTAAAAPAATVFSAALAEETDRLDGVAL